MGKAHCRSIPLPRRMANGALTEIGVRDCPYGICCPWVREGWDLDALGKFFRRRRRRPRPLLFRQVLNNNKSSLFIISHEK